MAKDPAFKQTLLNLKGGMLRKHIEEVEKAKDYHAAGDLYAELIDQYPNDPKLDELLYNAGVDYERSKLIGRAIVMRQQLIKQKPDSPLAKKAIFLIGRNYQAIAAFELAADNYETFANKYPGETDASSALLKAAFFRRGLGENEKSIADTQQYTKLYGGRKEFIDSAASVNFGEGQIFTQQKDWDRLQKHLSTYLKTWGAKGGVDRQVVAHVELGMIAWRASCPVAGVNFACIELTRVRAGGAARVARQKPKKGKKTKKGARICRQDLRPGDQARRSSSSIASRSWPKRRRGSSPRRSSCTRAARRSKRCPAPTRRPVRIAPTPWRITPPRRAHDAG